MIPWCFRAKKKPCGLQATGRNNILIYNNIEKLQLFSLRSRIDISRLKF